MQKDDSLEDKLRCADDFMTGNKPGDALLLYKQAWDQSDVEDDERKVWILLSTSNAAIRSNEVKASQEALEKVFGLVHTGIVLGNPLFHLLLGLTYHLLDENPTAKEENFARAIICGGSKIFNGEEEHHVRQLRKVLEFPEATDTWETYEGCSLDTLNGATGYIATLIESRMGKPLPYDVVECSDDSDSDDDGDSGEEVSEQSDEDDEDEDENENEEEEEEEEEDNDEDENSESVAKEDPALQAVESQPNRNDTSSKALEPLTKRQKCES
ncbi:hypothetical protein MHU86_20598 [Fragilaria crotonensis]|nr:hypothetical protein MHU86_20598 [Fragilaria crotonensis]